MKYNVRTTNFQRSVYKTSYNTLLKRNQKMKKKIKDQLKDHFDKLLSKNQCGFRKGLAHNTAY